MIDWTKGLTPEQKELLKELEEYESTIIPQTHMFQTSFGKTVTVFGRLLPKNKLIKAREHGYTYYVENDGVLTMFSAFSYKYKGVKC